MKIAKVCKKWELVFDQFSNECDVSRYNRSYLHYAYKHVDFVAAKAWATKWLFEDILDSSGAYSIREYMAGIGIQTLIAQKSFKIKSHIVGELDQGCVDHLKLNTFDYPILVKMENANKSILDNDNSDIKLLDLPNSSILQITTKWKNIFYSLFESSPKLIVWTDTAVAYPMAIHGKTYSKIFNENVTNKYDYINSYSKWLYRNFGYSIKKAAFRGNNAVYLAALKGTHEIEFKEFPLKDFKDGFYFKDENKNLESFFYD